MSPSLSRPRRRTSLTLTAMLAATLALAATAPSSATPAGPSAPRLHAPSRVSVGPLAGPSSRRVATRDPVQVQEQLWGGYAVRGSGFTKATVSWIEPTVTCDADRDEMVAFWPGIGGFNTATVQQDGTLVYCHEGQATHYTWWETYPTNAAQFVGSTVQAGDHITATVTRSGSDYTMSVTDSTHTENSFSVTRTCTDCDYSTAEWVMENPGYPVPDFGTVTYTGATATDSTTSGGISSFADRTELTLVNGSGDVMAQPSALTSGGKTFSVAWLRAE